MTAIAMNRRRSVDREHRFFAGSAILMALLVVSGFAMSLAMGRSSFAVPWFLHVHAFFFFGWTLLYLTQTLLVGTGSVAVHRRLGWLALGWIPAMVAAGSYVTIEAARFERIPFFFQRAYFVVLDPVTLLTFAGLAAAAIALRRRSEWHRRLMFCAMALLTGPAIGRLLPMPLLMPFAGEVVLAAILLFPLAGIVRDLSTRGHVHPAWMWGVGTLAAMQIALNLVTFSPAGPAIYRAMTVGTPAAAADPLAFPPPPWARPHA